MVYLWYVSLHNELSVLYIYVYRNGGLMVYCDKSILSQKETKPILYLCVFHKRFKNRFLSSQTRSYTEIINETQISCFGLCPSDCDKIYLPFLLIMYIFQKFNKVYGRFSFQLLRSIIPDLYIISNVLVAL